MSSDILAEARLLMFSVLTGAGLMALYDLLRLFRLVITHSWFWIGLEDLLYWIFSGFVTFYLLYMENDGAIRLYVIGAVMVSMLVCDRVLRAFLRKVLKKARRCFRMK